MGAIVEISDDCVLSTFHYNLPRVVVALERTECQPHVEMAFRFSSTA